MVQDQEPRGEFSRIFPKLPQGKLFGRLNSGMQDAQLINSKGKIMKNSIIAALAGVVLAGSATAQDITITVQDVAVNDDGSMADKCPVSVEMRNDTAAVVNLRLAFDPVLVKGSFSEMVLGAVGDVGLDNVLFFKDVAPGAAAVDEDAMLGVACADVEEILFTATCDGGDCTQNILISEDPAYPSRLIKAD